MSSTMPPVYRSDYFMPRYRPGDYGPWRIQILPLGHDHGYYTGVWSVQNMPVLLKRTSSDTLHWESWMSLSPHEMESQELGFKHAFGHTVVMGLGLGWLAVNAALNPNVERVTVVEIDDAVIELIQQSGALNNMPDEVTRKLRIVPSDALKWQPDEKVDFLYADIWRDINEPQVIDDVRRMQCHVKADAMYWWGQEVTLFTEARRLFPDKSFSHETMKKVIQKMELPLITPGEEEYVEMVNKVIENRESRGFGI